MSSMYLLSMYVNQHVLLSPGTEHYQKSIKILSMCIIVLTNTKGSTLHLCLACASAYSPALSQIQYFWYLTVFFIFSYLHTHAHRPKVTMRI